MKKFSLVMVALIVVIGSIGVAMSAAAKKPYKVKAQLTLQYNPGADADPDDPYDPYDTYGPATGPSFSGELTPKPDVSVAPKQRHVKQLGKKEAKQKAKSKEREIKRKLRNQCEEGRTITIRVPGGPIVGETTTNEDGEYVLPLASAPDPGKYRAIAQKKRGAGVKGRGVVCRKIKSKLVTVPN